MLARWHQLGLHVGVHLLELNACSLITCITVQGVSAEPLVNFFTKESSAISCLLFFDTDFCFGMLPRRRFEVEAFLSNKLTNQPVKQEERIPG